MSNLRRYMQQESGTALLASVLLVTLITGAGLVAVMTTSVNQNRSKNALTSKQAFYLADAGIQHAKTYLTSNWSSYTSPLTNTSFATYGGYSVTIQNGGNGSLLLTSTGTAGDAQAVIQSLMTGASGTYTPRYAFVTGKNLTMNVNASIQGGTPGASGGVHANGNLTIVYSPTITSDATASGSYTNAGTPTIGGTSGGSKPLESLPSITPTDIANKYYASRDYLLASDGNVYDKNGVAQPLTGGKWYGWKYSAPAWTMSGNSPQSGTLYVQGDVVISGFGTSPPLWITSIIATGSITVSSKYINVRPPTSTDVLPSGSTYHPETQNILFLAGGDLKLAPTSGGSAQFQGMALANEQVQVMGDSGFQFTGSIVAADAATSATVVSGDDALSYTGGSYTTIPKIIYAGISSPTLGTSAQFLTWQAMQW